jgi:hypothetical protein
LAKPFIGGIEGFEFAFKHMQLRLNVGQDDGFLVELSAPVVDLLLVPLQLLLEVMTSSM